MNKKIAIDPAEPQPATVEAESRAPAPRPAEAPAPGPWPAEAPTPTPPQDVRSHEVFFPPERHEELRRTWLGIQSGFIDEPRQAVRNADGLVREILSSVSEKFESARRNLEAEWDRGEEASTEALRLALQRYRALFDRLLGL